LFCFVYFFDPRTIFIRNVNTNKNDSNIMSHQQGRKEPRPKKCGGGVGSGGRGFGFEREGRSHGRCFSWRKMGWKKKPNMTTAKELSSYILP
jgi:hypothetical protein